MRNCWKPAPSTGICGRRISARKTRCKGASSDVGKTLIVIAHRLSTIVGADNIVVVKDGTIHAQGTHEKLLETCPLYRDMWQAHIGAKDQM